MHIPLSLSPWLPNQQTMHQIKVNTFYVDSITIGEKHGFKVLIATWAIAHVKPLETLACKDELCHM